MIAPSCYPVNVAEAIVNIKLLQALSETGQFSIDLISRRWKWEHYPSDTLESFDILLNSHDVIEVDNVINVKTVFQNLLTFIKFGVIYKGYHWAYPTWKTVRRKLKYNQYDYVLTKDAPSLLIGYHLKKHFGLKWVATWNDPCPRVMYPEPYGKGLGAKLTIMQRRIINMMKQADIHIFPNIRICNYMNKYLCVDKEKCVIIPHVIIPTEKRVEHLFSDKLRLIHSGFLGNPRNPETFLRALRLFLNSRPDAKISFTIMGHSDAVVKSLIAELKLEQYIFFISPKEYKESLQILLSYDIAVIIEADCEEGIYLPTKVSDFMQMSIPIFAISPSIGILNDLYKMKQIPYFADVKDINAIAKQIELVYEDFICKKISYSDTYIKEMRPDYVVKQYLSF